MDVIFVVVIVGFFALTIGLAYAFESLRNKP
jgi:hypothetical protein